MTSQRRTLFHKSSSGKMYSWSVWTDKDTVFTEHGTNNGEKVLTPKKCNGKNIGKKNETTPEEQAIKESNAMYAKKLEGKYRKTIDEASVMQINPMLAQDFFKYKDKIIYPIAIQPKLDGARCIAFWENKEIKLMSRGGKELNLPHIKEQVASFLPEWAILDGEIYNHDITFQETMRLMKKHRDNTDTLNYCVYDSLNRDNVSLQWKKRSKIINEIIPKNLSNISPVSSILCDVEKDALKAAAEYVSEGYEGGIARTFNGIYKFGGRSKDLLKIKTFIDKEYKITGFTTYKMRLVENNKPIMINCIKWTCITEDGKEFGVVPTGTVHEKNEMLKNAKFNIGKMLTVKYFELSEDNIPRFPVGLAIRKQNIQGA